MLHQLIFKLLKKEIDIPLNLEMAPTQEMLDIALEARPERICLVPEKRLELTTEGGLDVISQKSKIKELCDRLRAMKIRVSLFIDPDEEQITAASETGAGARPTERPRARAIARG